MKKISQSPFCPEIINTLKKNEIFIFGSNENGNHYGGAARIAYERFGATWGQAVGWSGNTYAVPTLNKKMQKVSKDKLISYLTELFSNIRDVEPETHKFYLTKIGCGIAGWSIEEVCSCIKRALMIVFGRDDEIPNNLFIPKDFVKFLK